MQWWIWVVIWTVLIVGLLATFVFLGWRLVRKGLAIVAELELLADRLTMLQQNVENRAPEAPANAILDGYSVVADRRDRFLARRTHKRELRSQRRIRRGKLLIASVPMEGRTDVR